ncbi:MAG: universal stress protein [Bacteroidetes bacterium]|jgi:nucleotide-binding universal stress UspA family protein|nr:universal stress protein [Bacteroidota bacterium]
MLFSQKPGDTDKLIVVPVDYSPFSKNAARIAMYFANILKARVYLFHTYFLPSFEVADITGQSFTFNDIKQEVLSNLEEREREQINQFEQEVGNEFPEVSLEHVLLPGILDEELIKFTGQYHPQFMVLGLDDKSPYNQNIFNSTAESILRKCKVPILSLNREMELEALKLRIRIGYLTHFDETDFESIKKMLDVTRNLDIEIKCMHISEKGMDMWDQVKLDGLKEYFRKVYELENVSCLNMESKNVLNDLQELISNEEIDILAFTIAKRNLISKILRTDISQKVLHKLNLPMLVFHK